MFLEPENRLLRKNENVTFSSRCMKRITKAILDNHDFIASVATIVKKDTEKALDIKSKRKD